MAAEKDESNHQQGSHDTNNDSSDRTSGQPVVRPTRWRPRASRGGWVGRGRRGRWQSRSNNGSADIKLVCAHDLACTRVVGVETVL